MSVIPVSEARMYIVFTVPPEQTARLEDMAIDPSSANCLTSKHT